MDIHQFGLENGFLPKHSKAVLDEIKESLEIISLDSKPVAGYYIGNKNRKIGIKLKL